jgi:hypothetical protein
MTKGLSQVAGIKMDFGTNITEQSLEKQKCYPFLSLKKNKFEMDYDINNEPN